MAGRVRMHALLAEAVKFLDDISHNMAVEFFP